jgi:hypothetical protein
LGEEILLNFGAIIDNDSPKSFVIQHKIIERCPFIHSMVHDFDRKCKKITSIMFDSLEDSLEWLNHNPVDLVGVYKLKKIDIEHKKMGTQKVIKDVPKEVEEDVMKWVIKEEKEI